jgi:hypothetical protein
VLVEATELVVVQVVTCVVRAAALEVVSDLLHVVVVLRELVVVLVGAAEVVQV